MKNKYNDQPITGCNPECTRCPLHKVSQIGGKAIVCQWGQGTEQATIMLVGDTPGKDELFQNAAGGSPAAQLLYKYLKLAGIGSESMYISNCVKCKPEHNKAPKPSEIKACAAYLDYEISVVKPKVIGLLGALAFERVLGLEGITKYRGKPMWSEKYQCWCVPTWHPAYVLRNGESIEDTEQFRRDLTYIKKIADTGETGQLKSDYRTIDTLALFKEAMLQLHSSKMASVDTETYGDFLTGKIITIQFSVKPGTAFVIPFYKPMLQPMFAPEDEKYVWAELKAYLEDSQYKKVGQNIKYDYQFLKYYGITMRGVLFDTMLGHYLLNENAKG